jgi:outer membrane protein
MHPRKHRMQNPIRLVALAALAATGLAAPVLAQAQAQGITVKGGVIQYNTNSKTDGVTGVGIPAGADAKTGNATTALLTFEYEFLPSVGVELVLGIPPKITAKGTGSVAFLGEVLSARNVAPTLLFNYHFDLGGGFRPYIGLGVNYTKFIDVKSPYFADVKLSDSKGLAGQIGFDYDISKDWGLFASVGKAQVKSKVVAQGATVLQSTIDFRPITFAFGAGYKF